VETVDFFPDKFTLPFPSAQDLATQAAADLTHALLHPLCKVGDEQTIALKRLANIFKGAKRRKSKVVVTPTDGVKHNYTTNVSPSKHIITLNTKFPSQTKNTYQTCSHTTNTACHGATQCWAAT
jgi:hypothetical protein